MKILIPIAGKNQNDSDYYIRSLYEIQKKTIIQYVYESLSTVREAEFVMVLRREDILRYSMDRMLRLMIPGVKIVVAQRDTQGSACSCLLAVDEIEDDEPLIIAGSDQLLNICLQDAVDKFMDKKNDGGIIIFDDIHPRWSYVKLDDNDYVIEASEKKPISRNAATGFYYFRKGGDFILSAESMIKKGGSVNGQYYVAPAYNEMVLMQKKIGVYRITKKDYYNLNQQKGIDDYELFLKKQGGNR